MNIYKVFYSKNIEVKGNDRDKAEDILTEQDGNGVAYFTDRAEAKAYYDGIELSSPAQYGSAIGTLTDFSGKLLECGKNCDEPEDGDLAEAYLSATAWDVEEIEIG